MKILLDKYPKGTYKGQISDGKFMDGYLYSNLEIMAKSIVRDMTFMGIIFSSTLEVGTGKSVLATQIGEAWTEVMKKTHNIDVPFTTHNVVWRPKELIERAFQVPRYSCILLDEWEDQTYWSEMGMTLRHFFRKCRQLNLFILVIIPNWFQMNINYAVSRSAFAIDVKFGEGFKRGLFSFYGFDSKRDLYIKGKKEHNYRVAKPDFNGRFIDGYGIPEDEYRRAKLEDLKKWEDKEEKPPSVKQISASVAKKIYESTGKLTQPEIAKALGISMTTLTRWFHGEIEPKEEPVSSHHPHLTDYTSNPIEKVIDWSEGEDHQEEKK